MADTTTRDAHATRRAGRRDGRRPPCPRRRTFSVLTATVALVVGACSADERSDETAAEPAAFVEEVDVATAADAAGWDDEHTHLEVVTVNVPGAQAVRSTDDGADDADAGAGTGEDQPEPDRTGDEPLTLVTPSGSRVLDGPPPGLLPVEPATADEARALEAAEPGSFIAVDVDGVLGAPGGRYVRSLTTITALPTGGDIADDANAVEPEPGDEDEVFAELDDADGEPDDPDGAPDGTEAIEVQVGGGETDEEIVEQIEALDGVVEAAVVGPGIIAVTVEDERDDVVAAEIGDLDGVDDVSEDLLAYVSEDPRQGEQWAITNTGAGTQAAGWPGVAGADIGAVDGWTVTTGSGVTVAVIDSGQDLDHRDLAANTWSNPDEDCANGVDDDANGFVDDCTGWDFGSNDNTPSVPPSGNGSHGTHVAGIVAAAANGVGVVGAAPDATLLPLKVARENGAIPMSAVAAAINYAVDNGAQVINLSLGTAPGTYLGPNSSTELAIRNARERNVLVVVAAGNDGANLDTTGPGYPAGFAAMYDNVIAVGASTNSDTHAYFSNTGSIVGIHAPGWAVLSTLPGDTDGMKYGTSMAAPYVAGAAAAVIASGRATDPAAVISRLRSTADDLGWGSRLDLAAAVGYEPPLVGSQLAVSVHGADTLVADEPGRLDWSITAPDDMPATGVRMSVAALHQGAIGAVDGLELAVGDAAGPLSTVRSDEEGGFPVVPIRDAASLAADGLALSTTATLPATEYAFVVELVDDSGAAVSAPYVSYVSVRAPAPPDTMPPTGGSDGSGGPGDGGAPTTQPPTPPTTIAPGAPTTTTPAGPGTPGTTPPDGGAPAPPTTQTPVDGGGQQGGGPSPGTTVAPGPGTPTTTPGESPTTTAPAVDVPTTAVPPDDGPTTPATTTTSTVPSGTPSPDAPPTTLPDTTPTPGGQEPDGPDPAQDGEYRALAVTPNTGSIDGFTRVVVSGSFPAAVPVYVWFGDQPTAAVRATPSASGLLVDTPAVEVAGTRDVIVKFETDRPYELRLRDAFTYTESTPGGPTTPGPGDGSGGSGGSGQDGGQTPTTVPGTPPSTAPSGGSPTPPPSGGDTTTTTTTTTTVPTSPPGPGGPDDPGDDPGTGPPPPDGGSGGGGGQDPGTEPPAQRELGSLTLRPQPSTGALSRLTTGAWPSTGCRADVCPASAL